MRKINFFSRFKIYFNDDTYNYFRDVFVVLKHTYGIDSLFLLDMDHRKCLHYGLDKKGYEIDEWMEPYVREFAQQVDVHYSMDASSDPFFRDIFEKTGSRTSLFIPLRMEFKSKPAFQNREFYFDLEDIMHIGFKRANAITETEMVQLSLLVNQYAIRYSAFGALRSFINLNAAIYEGIPFGLMSADRSLMANINSAGRKILGLGEQKGIICTGMGMCYSCDRTHCVYRGKHLIDLHDIFEKKALKEIEEAVDRAINTLESYSVKFWHKRAYLQFMIVPFISRLEDLKRFYAGESQSSQVSTIISFEDLTETIENQRMKREMEIAKKIQMELLPRRNLSIRGLDIKAAYIPSMVVGGDYYDFVSLGQNKYGFVIGDVSGKGVSAAFFMAELKGAINSAFTFEKDIVDVALFINNYLRKTKKRGYFVTMIIGVLDTIHGYLDWIRCGHDEPLLYRKEKEKSTFLVSRGIGFNLLENSFFGEFAEKKRLWLSPGDLLFFYTDGITDRMNSEGDLFG
ncbi:MAG TPA: hypothetical protein ENL15_02740, partial [Firmicutes bacterium]|nr:hypothetical protein [Bacillota bacterium]